MSVKALVTGGTGFIGSHVVQQLLSRKIGVRCLIRGQSNRANLAGLDVEYVIGDLRDAASLKTALHDCDWLFHVAADYRLWARDPEEMHRTNVEGTRQLLQAAADAKVKKIVYTSSVAAVGRPPHPAPSPQGEGTSLTSPLLGERSGRGGDLGEGVGREDLDPTPQQLVSPYKKSKFASELVAREFARQGLPIVIVNPAAPIGSQDIKPTPTGRIIVDFLNRRMPAYLETGMNFIDVEDVAAGHCLAAERGVIGERYILGHRNMTLKRFLDALASISGLPAPRLRIPYAVAYLAGAVSTGWARLSGREPAIPLDGVRMAHEPMYYDPAKAVRELGLPQSPIEGAIGKAVQWFRDKGYVRV